MMLFSCIDSAVSFYTGYCEYLYHWGSSGHVKGGWGVRILCNVRGGDGGVWPSINYDRCTV